MPVSNDDAGAPGTEVEALLQNGQCPGDTALQPVNQSTSSPNSVFFSNNMQLCYGSMSKIGPDTVSEFTPLPSTGTIYWQMNKGWPSLLWNLYNNDGDQAGSHFGVQEANRGLHALYALDNGTVTLDNLTNTTQPGLSVESRVFSLGGTLLDDQTASNTCSCITQNTWDFSHVHCRAGLGGWPGAGRVAGHGARTGARVRRDRPEVFGTAGIMKATRGTAARSGR